jgi:hypothetical protein
MSVTISYPKLRLAAQLREAGGQTVAESIEAANANLETIRPACLDELRSAVAAAAAACQRFPAGFDAQALHDLYTIAARAVGVGAVCGVAGADEALVSLCDLLDRLVSRRRCDLEAIGVHVRALQLLASQAGEAMEEAATQQVLDGLRRVSARYAELPAAAAN